MGTSTGAQISAATASARASRPNALQRSRHGRQTASTTIAVKSARNDAKIISASAAMAKNRPASAAFFSFGSRSVFNR